MLKSHACASDCQQTDCKHKLHLATLAPTDMRGQAIQYIFYNIYSFHTYTNRHSRTVPFICHVPCHHVTLSPLSPCHPCHPVTCYPVTLSPPSPCRLVTLSPRHPVASSLDIPSPCHLCYRQPANCALRPLFSRRPLIPPASHCVCVYVCVIRVTLCTDIYIHMYICIYIYINLCTYMYIYIHIYIYRASCCCVSCTPGLLSLWAVSVARPVTTE